MSVSTTSAPASSIEAVDALDHVGAVQHERLVALARQPAVVLAGQIELLERRAHAAVVDDHAPADRVQEIPHRESLTTARERLGRCGAGPARRRRAGGEGRCPSRAAPGPPRTTRCTPRRGSGFGQASKHVWRAAGARAHWRPTQPPEHSRGHAGAGDAPGGKPTTPDAGGQRMTPELATQVLEDTRTAPSAPATTAAPAQGAGRGAGARGAAAGGRGRGRPRLRGAAHRDRPARRRGEDHRDRHLGRAPGGDPLRRGRAAGGRTGAAGRLPAGRRFLADRPRRGARGGGPRAGVRAHPGGRGAPARAAGAGAGLRGGRPPRPRWADVRAHLDQLRRRHPQAAGRAARASAGCGPARRCSWRSPPSASTLAWTSTSS